MNIISLYCNTTCIYNILCKFYYNRVYLLYFVRGRTYWTIPPFVEPLLIIILFAKSAISWCRRTSVRPPDDLEKSVAHRLHCAMPYIVRQLCYPSKISPTILVKLACSLRHQSFFQWGLRHLIFRECGKQRPKLSEERWRLSNRNPA